MDLTRLKASLHPDITATEIDARQMVNGMLYEYEGAVIGDFRIVGDKVALITFETKDSILVEPGTKVKVTGRPAITLTQAQAMKAQLDVLYAFLNWLAWNRGIVFMKPAEPGDLVVNGDPVVARKDGHMVRVVGGPPELVRIAYHDYTLTTPELAAALTALFPNYEGAST